MVNDLSQESFISMMCLLIDYHLAVHDANPVEVTATMHTDVMVTGQREAPAIKPGPA
jgi:hypothetical protein